MYRKVVPEIPILLPFEEIKNFRPKYEWSDKFQSEVERLKTFENWPLGWLDTKVLAMTGMFYTGADDITKCYFCEVVLGRWKQEDKPVQEHLRWSPNCSLLKRRVTNNIPINAEVLYGILPEVSHDVCGMMQPSYRRSFYAYATDLSPALVSSTNRTDTFYPEYSMELVRCRSFAEWPQHMQQTPQQLAEAGFFYTGIEDGVKCFSCGVGLKHWEADDEPWEQHALWMANCSFVQLTKGQLFIKTVLNKFKMSASMEDALVCPSSQIVVHNQNQESEQASPIAPILPNDIKQKRSEPVLAEEKLCKICFSNEYNTAFLSCGHVVSCDKCTSSITHCPICRNPFNGVVRLYFS